MFKLLQIVLKFEAGNNKKLVEIHRFSKFSVVGRTVEIIERDRIFQPLSKYNNRVFLKEFQLIKNFVIADKYVTENMNRYSFHCDQFFQ